MSRTSATLLVILIVDFLAVTIAAILFRTSSHGNTIAFYLMGIVTPSWLFIPSHADLLVYYLLTAIIFLYAAYWAFSIKLALSERLYRNQALRIGLVSLGFEEFTILMPVVESFPKTSLS